MSVPSKCSDSGMHASLFGRAECFKLFSRVVSSSSASGGRFPVHVPNKICQKSKKVKVTLLISSLQITFQTKTSTLCEMEKTMETSIKWDRENKSPDHPKYDRRSSL